MGSENKKGSIIGDYNKLQGVYELPLPGGGSLFLSAQWTGECKAKFEDWLEARARRRLFNVRATLSPMEYRESLDAVTKCELGWGTDAMLGAIGQVPGVVMATVILAGEADRLEGKRQEMTPEKVLALTELMVVEAKKDERGVVVEPEVKFGEVLGQALKAIRDASPNFLAPPTRGTAV